MGIGRREFLRLFSSGIATVAAGSSNAIAIHDDQYVNWRLGIAFQKPSEWVFADAKQMGEVKAGQVLDLDDLALSREIIESVDLPILTISRDGISSDANRFTPGVAVFLDRVTLESSNDDERFVAPIESMTTDADSCNTVLKNFRVLSSPLARRVSGCDAAEYEASFVFEHKNMQPTPVRMKTLAINQGAAFYTLRMYDSPYVCDGLEFDYTTFIASVKMV